MTWRYAAGEGPIVVAGHGTLRAYDPDPRYSGGLRPVRPLDAGVGHDLFVEIQADYELEVGNSYLVEADHVSTYARAVMANP